MTGSLRDLVCVSSPADSRKAITKGREKTNLQPPVYQVIDSARQSPETRGRDVYILRAPRQASPEAGALHDRADETTHSEFQSATSAQAQAGSANASGCVYSHLNNREFHCDTRVDHTAAVMSTAPMINKVEARIVASSPSKSVFLRCRTRSSQIGSISQSPLERCTRRCMPKAQN